MCAMISYQNIYISTLHDILNLFKTSNEHHMRGGSTIKDKQIPSV